VAGAAIQSKSLSRRALIKLRISIRRKMNDISDPTEGCLKACLDISLGLRSWLVEEFVGEASDTEKQRSF